MKNLVLLIVCAALAFAACRKIPNYDDLSSDLIVATNYDKTAAFNTYKTYYISDTVINLGGTGADTILVDNTAKQLVTAVKNNMNARGYTFAPRISKPDLGLKMGVVKNLNVDVYSGWWSGYAGWYPYYWGGYYPYYYPWTTVYTYTTGTIILDTYDVKNVAKNRQYKAIWNEICFGALGSDQNANEVKGVNAINQGFTQAPYFKAN